LPEHLSMKRKFILPTYVEARNGQPIVRKPEPACPIKKANITDMASM